MSYEPVPGMRVECIRTESIRGDEDVPQKGKVYVVRDAFVCDRTGNVGLHLVEIVNPKRSYTDFSGTYWCCEIGWDAANFRPLDERRLDVFRAALTKAPGPWERVDA